MKTVIGHVCRFVVQIDVHFGLRGPISESDGWFGCPLCLNVVAVPGWKYRVLPSEESGFFARSSNDNTVSF